MQPPDRLRPTADSGEPTTTAVILMNLPAAPLALTYDECRARFRHAAWRTGRDVETCAIAATGPDGQRLSIDVTAIGAAQPEQALVLLLVHAVNLWGMAWWRRQNESNVDLNRNCRRDDVAPVHNDAYDELHTLACPDTDALPEVLGDVGRRATVGGRARSGVGSRRADGRPVPAPGRVVLRRGPDRRKPGCWMSLSSSNVSVPGRSSRPSRRSDHRSSMGVALGLAAAVCFGSGDFLGGRATATGSARAVLFLSQLTAALAALPIALVAGGHAGASDVLYGAGAGFVNGAGLALLYRGLATGRMGTVAPITAVVGAIVPIVWAVLDGERPDTVVTVGIVFAVAAAALVSRDGDEDTSVGWGSVALAVGAGLLLGTSLILFAQTSDDSGMWPVLAARLTAMALAAVSIVVVARPSIRLGPRPVRLAIGAGLCDVTATTALLIGLRHELTAVIAPIAALAPGFTVVWAAAVGHERVDRSHRAGLALALVGLALIAGG